MNPLTDNKTAIASVDDDEHVRSRRPVRRILCRVLWMGLMFVIGGIAGSAVTVKVIAHIHTRIIAHPELMAEKLTEMIRCDAGLNESETRQVRAIVDRHHERLVKLHTEVHPQIVAEFDGIEAEVGAILTDSQRERWLPRFHMLREIVAPKVK